MQLLSSISKSSRHAFVASKRSCPVAVISGTKPRIVVQTHLSVGLKYFARTAKCFSLETSVDSSRSNEYFLPQRSSFVSSLVAGPITF